MSLIRPLLATDIESVLRIQAQCYLPDNIESGAVIRTRLASAPDTAWVAELDGEVCAYLVGYRSRLGEIGALGDGFEPATEPDCIYLHDLAVGTAARGLRIGQQLVTRALELARSEGLPHAALVSVQDSARFWQRLGFAPWSDLDAEQAARLATYSGQPAGYRVRQLQPPAASRPRADR